MFSRISLALILLLITAENSFAQKPKVPKLDLNYLKNPGGLSNIETLKNLHDNSPSLGGVRMDSWNSLQNGQTGNAKVNCLQEASDVGTVIPGLNKNTAWEFANLGTRSSLPKTPSSRAGSADQPPAYRMGRCEDSELLNSCQNLLAKSLSDPLQASYKTSLNGPDSESIWREVNELLGFRPIENNQELNGDLGRLVVQSRDLDTRAMAHLLNISNQNNMDSLLLASQALVGEIDWALARGDQDAVMRAKILLSKLNPSALYAIDCLVGRLPFNGLNQNLDSSGRPKSQVGPLSGFDFLAELTESELANAIQQTKLDVTGGSRAGAVGGGADLSTILKNMSQWGQKMMKKMFSSRKTVGAASLGAYGIYERERSIKLAKQELALKEMDSFMDCKGKGRSDCDVGYPNASAAFKEREEKERQENSIASEGAGGPVRHDPDKDSNVVVPAPIAPIPENKRVVEDNLIVRESVLIPILDKNIADGIHVDPSQASRFCSQAVREFQAWVMSGVKMNVHDLEVDLKSNRHPSVDVIGVTEFDKWDESADFFLKPEFGQNGNCQTMDPVR